MHCPECYSVLDNSRQCPHCGAIIPRIGILPQPPLPSTVGEDLTIPSAHEIVAGNQKRWRIDCSTCAFSDIVLSPVSHCPECGSAISVTTVNTSISKNMALERHLPSDKSSAVRRRTRSEIVSGQQRPVSRTVLTAPLEGIVRDRFDAPPESPDFDWGRLFFGLLLIVDLAIVGLTAIYIFLAISTILLILAALSGFRGPFFRLLMFLGNPLMAGFRAIFRAGRYADPRGGDAVPVTSFRVESRIPHGVSEFRLKGRLVDTVIAPGDWVRVWGPNRNGVIHFRRGQRLQPSTNIVQQLRRPVQLQSGWLLFVFLCLGNLAAFYWLR